MSSFSSYKTETTVSPSVPETSADALTFVVVRDILCLGQLSLEPDVRAWVSSHKL